MKKRQITWIIAAAAAIALTFLLLWQNGVFDPKPGEKTIGCVTLTVDCRTALECASLSPAVRSVLPEDGLFASEVTFDLKENDTAFSVLERFCRERRLALASRGSTRYGLYVEGIGELYEMDCGASSGWMFSVNGEFVSTSAGNVVLKGGDVLLWVYTCDLGKDVGDEKAP